MIKKSEKLLIFAIAFLFICALAVVLYMRTNGCFNSAVSLSTESGETRAIALADGLLNINLATAEQLDQLPGINTKLSRQIVEYRRIHGTFQSPDELLNIPGVNQDTLVEITPYITIGGNP